jgi:hypothetical protein
VAIMADGKLRASAHPLELKSRFGTGYRLALTVNLEQLDEVKQMITDYLPVAALASENAGNLVYSLPQNLNETVVDFFEHIQSGEGR